MKAIAGTLALLSATIGAACGRSDRLASQSSCPASWRREWTADSTIALCVEPAFVRNDAHTWQRPERIVGAPPRDFFSVELVNWPDDSASLQHWPPRLASAPDCQADCITVDSATSHTDRWAGVEASTEIGLASGGVAGLRRRPVMVSGWTLSSRRRGFAQGWAALPVTLDTLRQMLRTVQVVR